MEPILIIWLVGIGATIGGCIIGAIAYRNLTPTRKEASNLKAELDQAREEMESYKASVNSHFDKTSELVNELTQDYVKVYKHLAEGAQALGDSREFTNVLEQHQGKVLISVDNEQQVQDTIVSEVPADAQEPQQAPQVSSELIDEVVAQENISASGEGIEVDITDSKSPESVAQKEEKKEPVLEVVTSATSNENSIDVASLAGNQGVEEKPAVQSQNKNKTARSAATETEAEPA